ncbi:HlyD family secretion protein [Nitratifractor sp.]|uniref:HlyD family secretion protein n=1 Tax=Nitratifractor sp. TaxID=2268144 RepID=UPI0025D75B45|nr:HlyD family secretion protein [Nitratifractor sp.]
MKKIFTILIKLTLTLALFAAAGWFGWQKWHEYFQNPWTRDGQVRSQVVQVTPQVTGRVITLYVHDNQAVKKGDLLFEIDPSTYILKVKQAEVRLRRAEENAEGMKIEYERVKKIHAQDPGAVSQKDLNRNRINYLKALADIDSAKESLNNAKLNLKRTKVYAEVDGWVSNINFQVGSQAVANKPILALVDRHTFWVFGFFREDAVSEIKVGDEAVVTLMAYLDTPLKGRVESIAWGITPPDGNPGPNLLPKVKPVFQWIRLAQHIPVRIALENVPPQIALRVGLSASVLVHAGESIRKREGDGS